MTTARTGFVRMLVPVALIVSASPIALTACAETPASAPDSAGYRTTMNDHCSTTRQRVDALPEPPDAISVADFADEVASAIEQEADRTRRVVAPSELAADHRAFVRNSDDQARAWRDLARAAASGTATAEDLGALRTRIGELTLGRNDLAAEMDLTACGDRGTDGA